MIRQFSDHAEFRVLAAQYDQVEIIVWQPSWVMLPRFLSESDGQVVFVAAASHAASSSKGQWPMMPGKKHDKIVHLHQKETSREGDGRGKKFPVSRMDDGRNREPCFRYDHQFFWNTETPSIGDYAGGS